MAILISLLIALLGLVLYVMASNPRLVEIGRISFFCGLLAFALQVGGHSLSLLK